MKLFGPLHHWSLFTKLLTSIVLPFIAILLFKFFDTGNNGRLIGLIKTLNTKALLAPTLFFKKMNINKLI